MPQTGFGNQDPEFPTAHRKRRRVDADPALPEWSVWPVALTGTQRAASSGSASRTVRKETVMVLAIVLIVLAILLGLGGLVFTALKWLLIVAVVLLIAGAVSGFLARGKARNLR
jgi:hypothetical protein